MFGYVGCMPDIASLQSGDGNRCANNVCAGATSTGGALGEGGVFGTSGGASGTAATGGLGSTGTGGATGGQNAGGGAETAGQAAIGGNAPLLRFDFETNLQGWQPVGDQRPPDVQDSVAKSSDQSHQGSSSLAIVFDGAHATTVTNPFWGVYINSNLPSANATVTLWMYATAAGVSVNIYSQRSPDYNWQSLTTAAVPAATWTKIQIQIPDNSLLAFGCTLNSTQDYMGTVYLDDISW